MIYSEFISEVGGQANFAAAMATIMLVITAVLFLGQKYIINHQTEKVIIFLNFNYMKLSLLALVFIYLMRIFL